MLLSFILVEKASNS